MTTIISVWTNVAAQVFAQLGNLIAVIMDDDNVLLLVPIGVLFVYTVISVFKRLI